MPNIDNLNSKSTSKDRLISAKRSEVLYREDIKTAFGYSIVGIASVLALTGLVYIVGKQMIK
jgi:hypothetical protein